VSRALEYRHNKAVGLCAHCGKRKPAAGRTRCSRCIEYARHALADRRARLRARRFCIACGNRPASPGLARCAHCLVLRRTKSAAKRAKRRALRPPRELSRAPGTYVRGRQLHQVFGALRILRRGRWTIRELADELHIHWRTGYRLIDALRRIGVTVEVSREREGDRGIGSGYYTIPAEPLRKLLHLR